MKEILEEILNRYPVHKRDALLPMLQEIQRENGYLTEEVLNEVGRYLNLPVNKVYGVAAFYDQFRFRPLGHFHFQLCRGTACHLHGSTTYQGELEKQLKVKSGGTSRDQRFSLEIVNCLGACESAPVLRVNDIYYPHVTPEELTRIIQSFKDKTP
ncbi:MAG: NAD(P)H-dependent oxidoreductase subunit E [Bacteroidota bacterium]